MDLAALRQEYAATGLDEVTLTADPLELFGTWLTEAVDSGMHEPNAMVMATERAGQPAARMVLLKGFDEGFVFFTNYESDKGNELAANPRCALVFPWYPISRQVRVEGRASRVSPAESDRYFASRPYESQLGAVASPQSRVVADRVGLDELMEQARAEYGQAVERPEHWGGYRVIPELVEFWQGRFGRMHDRIRYRRHGASWIVERLAP
ncbi:MAG: pyridoxamine 5'-phosphate oxidase [Nocardioidaceae bacterium]|nr:MAG: pyridoxamine 5'-phosphate oxidase [Nocardioidaceae bacterium]